MVWDDDKHGPRPLLPCVGGPILLPCAQQERTKGVNWYAIENLANPHYHGKESGVPILIIGYLERCGYNKLSSDNVVGSLNEIISAHRHILETWHNLGSNTYGPQVDRILLKSFKLFPQLDSLGTADVVNFYDRFQELSPMHLMAIMPFDSIMLKNRYEGLCIPGLGTRRYADSSRALMDFLPHLIPGSLSSRINATLAVVRCKTNNGYDYFWRVLKLTVPGFDPVVAILTPQWAEYDNIFQFSQAYLLYFCLQGKMHYHYTDCTKSGIFLRAIQHSDYADTVTMLQLHVNSYREDYDTGNLPPHLHLHGLAKSIHQNAQSRLRDIAFPRVRCFDVGTSSIQGLPSLPSVNCFERQDHPGATFHDRDRNGGGSHAREHNRQRPGRNKPCGLGSHGNDCLRQQRDPTCPDQNRHPYLTDVQCDAYKHVGHVAKHCNMLATALCLDCYMKHDLSKSTRDAVKKEWLARWKERLGNPNCTPMQVM
jgi:hypothetical protein